MSAICKCGHPRGDHADNGPCVVMVSDRYDCRCLDYAAALGQTTRPDPEDESARHHRNGHLLELDGCMWRCLHCRHKFDAATDADLFWCGDDCTGRHHGDLARGGTV